MSSFGTKVIMIVPALKGAGVPGSVIDQLVRSATSVGANYGEARGAESRADFLHKLQISLKECRETKHWLATIQGIPQVPGHVINSLVGECDQLCAILYSSVKTAK